MYSLFSKALEEDADWRALQKNVRDGVSPISVFGVSDGQKTHLSAALIEDRPVLYVTQGLLSAEKVRTDLAFFTGKKPLLFPGREHLLQAKFQSAEAEQRRLSVLSQLLDRPDVVVVPAEALFFSLMPPEALLEMRFTVRKGERWEPREVCRKLTECGYAAVSQIPGKGEFFLHGGILDVYPPESAFSLRIDFFDDEVDSIREVDPVSQRSGERPDKAEFLPLHETCAPREMREAAAARLAEEVNRFNRTCKNRDTVTLVTDTFLLAAERIRAGETPADQFLPYVYPERTTILDYLPQNTLVVVDEVKLLQEMGDRAEEEFSKNVADLMAEGQALLRHGNVFTGFRKFFDEALKRQVLSLQSITGTIPGADARAVFRFEGRTMQSFHAKPEFLAEEVSLYKSAGYRTVICAGTDARAERIRQSFLEKGLDTVLLHRFERSIEPGTVAVVTGSPVRGFEYPKMKLAIVAENDIFSLVKQNARPAGKKNGLTMDTFVELKVGDAIVHETSGIGIYQGIVQIETDGVKHDYLFLKYRDDDKLYVPVEQMNRVQKYIAPEDTQPRLNKLGSGDWNKTKQKVRHSIEDMTDKLLALYRAREATPGIAFDPDTPWQRDFEEDFPYEETPDQLRAVREIKADMESPRAMDRLLCGDVGYGKTEVALRAVFKAVMSGRQAAILAPTTILAQQHFNTLKTRLVNFDAIRVEMLSRFRTPAEIRKVLKDVAAGKVDIIVGTHRLLGKDVSYKNLGLLVVDEEQRFGVAHKEKIKEIKSNVDVLTLSATPIPRTLNMALSGIRDMSLLETPPQERYPVQTYVVEYSEALLRDAITRELQRGGQVYYLYNRVQSIDRMAEKLREMCPGARVAVAHGQMDEKALEEIMTDFFSGEYDILLCTTIIENGVDIPGVNTIIVQDAHCFGLSQLYQLRGRVGRSNRLAYAYFTIPPARSIGEDAVKRLKAIEEFTQMGSGFRIAMRDLEIRGAGNLLGGEQHGHMAKIGYDLYCKMIRDVVDTSLGKKTEEAPRATVELKIDAYISDSYVPNEAVKFSFYRKISSIDGKDAMLDVRDELTDRFGPLPESVACLLKIAYLRALSAGTGLSAIRGDGDKVLLQYPKPELEKLMEAAARFPECAISAGSVFTLVFRMGSKSVNEKLDRLIEFMEYTACGEDKEEL